MSPPGVLYRAHEKTSSLSMLSLGGSQGARAICIRALCRDSAGVGTSPSQPGQLVCGYSTPASVETGKNEAPWCPGPRQPLWVQESRLVTLVSGWERPAAEPVGAVEERGAAWGCLDRYISCTCCRYISPIILVQEDATICLSITEPRNKAQCHPFLLLQPPPCKTGTEMLPRAKQWKEKNHARNKPTQRCRNSQLLCASGLQETQQNWIQAPGAPRAAPSSPCASLPACALAPSARTLPASSPAGFLPHWAPLPPLPHQRTEAETLHFLPA